MIIPRGIKNNNPCNIDRTADHWVGESDNQTDPRFVVFDDPKWGIRAATRILLGHYDEGQQNIQSLISSWAPGNENDTESYILDVSNHMNYPRDAILNLQDQMPSLIKAIIYHENGQQPYTDDLINLGIRLEGHL
jgi:hypothetical protein